MIKKTLYETSATARNGRSGHVRSDDGAIDLTLVVPKTMGGDGRAGANPETLFASGYAACFESATRLAAQKAGLKPAEGSYVTAKVDVGTNEKGQYELAVLLTVHLEGVDLEQAKTAAQLAHNEICPYSNATRNNIAVTLKVV